MDLSIIIPVWNEESKIASDLLHIDEHFRISNQNSELVVVDDGSTDSTINAVKEAFTKISLPSKVIICEHRGKGHAVRQGIMASCGKNIIFMDCGGNVSLNFIEKGTDLLDDETDIVLGTRYHPQSKIIYDMIWYRRITSAIFRNFTKIILKLPEEISDSQCGFKIFKGDLARKIVADIQTDGFLFDLEFILLAISRGYKFRELPLEWRCDRDSRLNLLSSLWPVLKELFYLKKF